MLYAIHHGEVWVFTEQNQNDAIQVAELAFNQMGGTWTVTVYDPRVNTLYDTIYVVSPS